MDDPITNPAAPAVLEGLVPALLAALLLVAVAICVGVWVLARRGRFLESILARMETLEGLQRSLEQLVANRDDLDLRRVEHVLLEMRDGQRRVEDALLARIESPRSQASADPVPGGAPLSLTERVTNRLLAMGYERVRLVDSLEDLAALGGEGEIAVEASRQGVLCKGRVLLRGGALSDVELKSAFTVFP